MGRKSTKDPAGKSAGANLGLIFLKYISDSFEEPRAKLTAGKGDYAAANPEDADEYTKCFERVWNQAFATWRSSLMQVLMAK